MQPAILLQELIEALSLGSLYGLATLGIALLFGIMGLVNFAYGELIMIGAYALTWNIVLHQAWFVVVVVVVITVMVAALLQERIAFRSVRRASGTTLMVTSFALSIALQDIAATLGGARPVGVSSPIGGAEQIHFAGLHIAQVDLITILTTLVLLVALSTFLQRTDIGIQMRAAAEDFRMARLLGVRADRVVAVAFAISGLLAGVLAILLMGRTGSVSPTIGIQFVLIGFVATVIGGMGRLDGAVLGGFLLGFLSIGIGALLPSALTPFRDAVAFSIVITVLLVRPRGILGGSAGVQV